MVIQELGGGEDMGVRGREGLAGQVVVFVSPFGGTMWHTINERMNYS